MEAESNRGYAEILARIVANPLETGRAIDDDWYPGLPGKNVPWRLRLPWKANFAGRLFELLSEVGELLLHVREFLTQAGNLIFEGRYTFGE